MPATGTLKHTWVTTVKNDTGSATVNDAYTILGSNEFNEKITVPAGATAEIDCGSLAYAKMTSLFLVCDHTATVYTNAADGTGGNVIDLEANKSLAWNSSLTGSNPITQNITKIYVKNTSTDAAKDATFRCGFLLNLLV